MIHKQAILFYSSALDGWVLLLQLLLQQLPPVQMKFCLVGSWPPPPPPERLGAIMVVCDFLLLHLAALRGYPFFAFTIAHTHTEFGLPRSRTHPPHTAHCTHFLVLQPRVLKTLGRGGSRLRVVVQHRGQEVGELDRVLEGPLVLFAEHIDEAPRFQAGDVAEFALGVEGVVGHPAGQGDPLGDGPEQFDDVCDMVIVAGGCVSKR